MKHQLLLLLTENKDYSTSELAERLGVSRRQIYNDFENLKRLGFQLVKTGTKYRLDRKSPFFKRLHENIALTELEAAYVYRLLDSVPHPDYLTRNIQSKLERFFSLDTKTHVGQRKQAERNAALLQEAIERHKVVVLKAYSSPSSHTVSDRLVEPFLFLNGGWDVRCYELKTHTNKTFKTTRATSVEICDADWTHERHHKAVYTDIFMFSGEERFPVKMHLGQLARNLMIEEFPLSEPFITPTERLDVWLLEMEVASFVGIGRFVLGLYDDICVLGSPDFKAYLERKVARMQDVAKSID